ncbi:MAG: hypothetical protein IKV46_00550 [Bacteroidales bacterium]|nr:hypothetical protein [Bacteroidales bacterium]
MKKILLIITTILLTTSLFSQKTPCNLTESIENGKTIYRGERNYVTTNYEDLRVCVQYLYDSERHCLELTLDTKEALSVEKNSIAYIQFAEDLEEELKLNDIVINEKNNKISCRYALSAEQEKIFSLQPIQAIYFSTKEYSQIEIPELNKYTAKKIMERFNCGINTIGK